MKRKIIKQGHGTLTITIPKKWVDKFNLSAGDEVELLERKNGLYFTKDSVENDKFCEFNITDMDVPTIWKYFMGVYRQGYTEVKVNFTPGISFEYPYRFLTSHRTMKNLPAKQNVLETLQNFVNRFIDFEIVEHGKSYVIIKEMGTPSLKQFDISFRRIFFLIKQMVDETLNAINNDTLEDLEQIQNIDITLDKFHDYCCRVLNQIGSVDKKSELLFATLYLLELVGDEFKNISVHLVHDKHLLNLDVLKEIAEKTSGLWENYNKIYFKYDPKLIKEMSLKDKEIYVKVPEMYRSANEEEKELFHHYRTINRYLNSLLELRIEMEF